MSQLMFRRVLMGDYVLPLSHSLMQTSCGFMPFSWLVGRHLGYWPEETPEFPRCDFADWMKLCTEWHNTKSEICDLFTGFLGYILCSKYLSPFFCSLDVNQSSDTLFRLNQGNRMRRIISHKNDQPYEALYLAPVCSWWAKFQWLVYDSHFPKFCLLHLTRFFILFFLWNPDRQTTSSPKCYNWLKHI